MSRYCMRVLVSLVSVFCFCLDTNAQIGSNNNVARSSGNFDGFLRDLGTMVYKKPPKLNMGKRDNFNLPIQSAPKASRSLAYDSQKAALDDVLMMKLVSYYEDKYKLVQHDTTTEQSREIDIFTNKKIIEMNPIAHMKNQFSNRKEEIISETNDKTFEVKSSEKVQDPDIEAMLDDMNFMIYKPSNVNVHKNFDYRRPVKKTNMYTETYMAHESSSNETNNHVAYKYTSDKQLVDQDRLSPNLNKMHKDLNCYKSSFDEFDNKRSLIGKTQVSKHENYRLPDTQKIYKDIDEKEKNDVSSQNVKKVYNKIYYVPPSELSKVYRKFDQQSQNRKEIDIRIPNEKEQMHRQVRYSSANTETIYDDLYHQDPNGQNKMYDFMDDKSSNIEFINKDNRKQHIQRDRSYKNRPENTPKYIRKTYALMMNTRPTKPETSHELSDDRFQNSGIQFIPNKFNPQNIENTPDDSETKVDTGYEIPDTTQEILQDYNFDINDQSVKEYTDYASPDISIL